ncbi:putative glucosylceramidase 4 [Tetranychus urticae]|uniref:Glucosylceramidase n=2 Tax=Tetranychus urticae TaxID=32264 RepID=T1KQI1_TETUR|nr:putative glucosylceramidase 4 [Tetranychus urticae]
MDKLLACTIVLLLFINTIKTDGCHKRKFKEDSFVCVCNELECDSFEPVTNPPKGLIYSYVSDKDEHRFHKDTLDPKTLNTVTADSIKLSINVNETYQQIIGFGGAFTDAAGINIKSLPDKLVLDLIRDYFGKDGLEYNMGRVTIGGADFSPRPYTHQDDYQDLNWTHFALAEEDLEYKIPYIKLANDFSGGLKLFGSMWSPPAWMKYQQRINGTGILIGDPGEVYYKAMASYMVKFLDEYKKHGVEFWGITTLNEPSAGFKPDYPFNCLGISPEQMTKWIAKDLGPILKAAGYGKDKLKLLILDDNVSLLFLYASRVFSNYEASQYVSGVAVHWYENKLFGFDQFDKTHQFFPDYFMLSTEACTGLGYDGIAVKLGLWSRGEEYANDLVGNMNHWSSGWVDWNLALNTIGGPNWVSMFVDSPIIVNAEKQEYYKQPMYYALAHFSKFLKPGSTRLGFKVTNPDDNVRTTVFKTDQNQLVVITVNSNDYAANLTIEGFAENVVGLTLGPHSFRTLVINKS